MNKIIYDVELQTKEQNEDLWNYYKKYAQQIKNNKDKIKLGLYCAKYCFKHNDKQLRSLVKKAINLIESWLIIPEPSIKKELHYTADYIYNIYGNGYNSIDYAANTVFAACDTAYSDSSIDVTWCLYYCSQIKKINMNLPNQYLQTLLRTTKQFNTNNPYSNHLKQIISSDIDKLELVDYNMLLDISNEHYNIDLSEFNYDNIFSRRNLIELIRREYNE